MKRWLCAFLAAVLLCTSCIGALADETDILVTTTDEENFVGDDVGVGSIDNVDDDYDGTKVTSDESNAAVVPEFQIEESQDEGDNQDEKTTDEKKVPDFDLPGYARVERDGTPVFEDSSLQKKILTLKADSAVLVFKIENDVASIALYSERGIQKGSMAADAFKPMDEDALNALNKKMADNSDQTEWYDQYQLPLLECAFEETAPVEEPASDPAVNPSTTTETLIPTEGSNDEKSDEESTEVKKDENETEIQNDENETEIQNDGNETGTNTEINKEDNSTGTKKDETATDGSDVKKDETETDGSDVKKDETETDGSDAKKDETETDGSDAKKDETATDGSDVKKDETGNKDSEDETEKDDSEPKEGEEENKEGEEKEGEGEETEGEEETEENEMAQPNVALTGIALSYGSLNIGLKENCNVLTVRPVPAEASLEGLTFAWVSSKPKVAKIKGAGLIYGAKKGSAVITVIASNGMRASCKVKVAKAPKSISISPASVSLYTNSAPYRLPRPTAKKGSCATYSYASSNNGVATVSWDGVVIPVAKGWTNITIRSYNGKKTNFRVNVYGIPAGIRFNQTAVNVCTGMRVVPGVTIVDGDGAATIGAPTFTLAESQQEDGEEGCISISGEGRSIGGVKKGKTYVVAHFSEFSTDTVCAVNVLKAPRTFAFGNGRTSIGKGEKVWLSPYLVNEDNEVVNGTYTVKSSKPKVVSVTAGGVIKGKKKGKAVLTFRAFNGVTVKRTITVVNAPKKATVAPKSVVLGMGQSTTLRVTLKKGTAGACSFSSTNNGVATVNGNGTVTAVRPGTAKINIRSYNGKAKCTATVYVVSGPAYIRLTNVSSSVEDDGNGRYTMKYTHTMQVGSTFKLAGMVEYPAPGSITGFTSENTEIATVTNSGEITALQPGIATIVARATNGATVNCIVYVQGADEAETSGTVVESYEPEYVQGEDDISIRFNVENNIKTMTVGDVFHNPGLTTDKGEAVEGAEFTSDAPEVAEINGKDIKAKGTGTAIITASYKGATATLQVNVIGPISKIVLSPAEYQGRKNTTVQLTATFASSLESGSVVYSSSNTSVATVSNKGLVTLVSAGVAEITATSAADSGVKSAAVTITVQEDPLNYRLFTACGYDSTAYSGSGRLPFTRNNAEGVARVFVQNSSLGYKHVAALRNPTKYNLIEGLKSFVNAGGSNDVSVIYICTHGHYLNGGYSLSLSTGEYVSSSELFNAIKGGSSRVVFILDSCYSGYFLNDVSGRLSSEVHGRISVLTASNNTRASYYNVSNTSQAVDFFTFFLMLGTGWDIRNHYYVQNDASAKGSAPGYMLADATNNHSAKDGVITVTELFNYAYNSVRANIPGYSKKSWFWGDKNQTPRYYAGNNGNLAIFRP